MAHGRPESLSLDSKGVSGFGCFFACALFGGLTGGGLRWWRAGFFEFDGDRRSVLETLQADTGMRGREMRETGEIILNPDVELLHAGDADVQQKIGIARECVTGNDLRNCTHVAAKLLPRLVDVKAETDIDEDVEIDTELLRVQQGDITLDEASGLHPLDAPCAGSHRQAKMICQFIDGAAGVQL